MYSISRYACLTSGWALLLTNNNVFALQDPFKSMVVLGIVFVAWLTLVLVSTRVIVFVVGVVSLFRHDLFKPLLSLSYTWLRRSTPSP